MVQDRYLVLQVSGSMLWLLPSLFPSLIELAWPEGLVANIKAFCNVGNTRSAAVGVCLFPCHPSPGVGNVLPNNPSDKKFLIQPLPWRQTLAGQQKSHNSDRRVVAGYHVLPIIYPIVRQCRSRHKQRKSGCTAICIARFLLELPGLFFAGCCASVPEDIEYQDAASHWLWSLQATRAQWLRTQ